MIVVKSRNILHILICLFFTFTAGTQVLAADGAQAQAFIDKMGKEAIGFLGDEKLDHQEKREKFRALLGKHFDMKTIGRFTLGSYWKNMTPAQREEYQTLFDDLIVDIYAQRFSDYRGQAFEVSGSFPEGESDYIVRSYIVPKTGENISVSWHVRHKNGEFKIIDIAIEDVSMTITKRSEFASIIQRGGGDVEVLLNHLRGNRSG